MRFRPPTAPAAAGAWRRCGENTAAVTCFSFYANKTITTGEGGMAVTDDAELADRMRQMSLHGLSHDAWKRYAGSGAWDYRIVAPGYKYNLTDVAAAIGIHQLARAEEMRREREAIAAVFRRPGRRRGDRTARRRRSASTPGTCSRSGCGWSGCRSTATRSSSALRERGVGCSVHWRPLHLHPYYEETFDWRPEHLPCASAVWPRLVSLPLFPGMSAEEEQYELGVVRDLCHQHQKADL